MLAARGDQGLNHLVVFVGHVDLDGEDSSVRSHPPISHHHDGQIEEQQSNECTKDRQQVTCDTLADKDIYKTCHGCMLGLDLQVEVLIDDILVDAILVVNVLV